MVSGAYIIFGAWYAVRVAWIIKCNEVMMMMGGGQWGACPISDRSSHVSLHQWNCDVDTRVKKWCFPWRFPENTPSLPSNSSPPSPAYETQWTICKYKITHFRKYIPKHSNTLEARCLMAFLGARHCIYNYSGKPPEVCQTGGMRTLLSGAEPCWEP